MARPFVLKPRLKNTAFESRVSRLIPHATGDALCGSQFKKLFPTCHTKDQSPGILQLYLNTIYTNSTLRANFLWEWRKDLSVQVVAQGYHRRKLGSRIFAYWKMRQKEQIALNSWPGTCMFVALKSEQSKHHGNDRWRAQVMEHCCSTQILFNSGFLFGRLWNGTWEYLNRRGVSVVRCAREKSRLVYLKILSFRSTLWAFAWSIANAFCPLFFAVYAIK